MLRGCISHLSGVGDEQHNEVRLGDDVQHLAEGAIGLAEASGLGLSDGGGVQAKANRDLDVHAGSGDRVLQVLRLRGSLGAPADDADRLDVLEGLLQLGELVAASADDELLMAGKLDVLLLEHLGVEVQVDSVGHLRDGSVESFQQTSMWRDGEPGVACSSQSMG